MVNAGIIPITIADSHLANFWAAVLPNIVVHSAIKVNQGRELALAFRKKSPKLKTFVNGFAKTHKAGTTFGNTILKRYLKDVKWVKNPTASKERKKFEKAVKFFKKYGKEYEFDYLLLAAQGYQESTLDHAAKSRAGAVGVMQLLPSTGKSMKVGNIQQLEPNIHAGTKYLRFMIDKYYEGEEMDKLDKMLFALASYNAGPSRISRLRKKAAKQGLDQNKWFGNVERVVAKDVGREPVQYVRNIYKYYLAYQRARVQDEAKATSRASL